jgi:hypothetical protein
MESRDFCFWLQGFFELSDNASAITVDQTEMIKRYLDLVFVNEIAPSLRERPAPSLPDPKAPPRPPLTPDHETEPDREPPHVMPTPRC